MAHPRYFIHHAGHKHELFLQPRSDTDYALRTKSLCHEKELCLVTDAAGKPLTWDLGDVGRDDYVEFKYPFSVSVEHAHVSETLLRHTSSEGEIVARPKALALHEELALRLKNMVREARCIRDEGLCSEEELRRHMAEPFDDEAIEELCHGGMFRYFYALHEHHGVKIVLKFLHVADEDREVFGLHFRAAKVLVPYGRHFEDFFRHEHNLGSLVTQNHIMRLAVDSAFSICNEMHEDRPGAYPRPHRHQKQPSSVAVDEVLVHQEPVRGVLKSIKNAAKSVGSAFSKAGKAVGKGAVAAGKAVGSRAVAAGKAVGSAAARAGRAVGSGVASAGRAVGGAARSAAGRVGSAASSVGARIRTAASSAATSVSSAAGRAKTAISSAAGRAKTAVSDTASRVKSSVVSKATSIKDKVSAKANQAKEAVSKRFGQVKDSVKGARDKVRDRVTSAKQSVRDKVQSLRGKNTSAGSASKPLSSSVVPQDKSTPVTDGSGNSRVAGVGTSGDPRSSATPPQAPPKPSSKDVADARAARANSNQAPPPPPKASPPVASSGDAGAAGSGAAAQTKPPPRRFGDPAPAPSQSASSVRPDDGLAKYNNPPPPKNAQTSKPLPPDPSKDPNKIKAPAPKPPESSAGAPKVDVTRTVDAKGAVTTTATTRRADGTTKTITSKERPDGTIKTTTTKTSADGKVLSKEQNNYRRVPVNDKSSSKEEKSSKEKKPGMLDKLKDKVKGSGGSSGSSGSGGSGGSSGGGESSSGGSGGASVPDSSGAITGGPDPNAQFRQEQADRFAQQQQPQQQQQGDRPQPQRIDFDRRQQAADAALAGAVTGAVVGGVVASSTAAAYNQPPPPPGYVTDAAPGVPPQGLPPGYVLTANGVMSIGIDGRVYPMTQQQAAYLQAYQAQQAQGGAAPGVALATGQGGAVAVADASSQDGAASAAAAANKYTPSYTARLADDDEPLAVQDTSPPLIRTPIQDTPDELDGEGEVRVSEEIIAAQLSEDEDRERRELVIKYFVGQFAGAFGRSPTKVQKDKLRSRIFGIQRPFNLIKVSDQYTKWLVEDMGVK